MGCFLKSNLPFNKWIKENLQKMLIYCSHTKLCFHFIELLRNLFSLTPIMFMFDSLKILFHYCLFLSLIFTATKKNGACFSFPDYHIYSMYIGLRTVYVHIYIVNLCMLCILVRFYSWNRFPKSNDSMNKSKSYF